MAEAAEAMYRVSAAATSSDERSDVYQQLRDRLLIGDIPPGARLNIEKLARESGVSPTLVREALLRLEGDDLVVRVHNKGYRTTELLNVRELEELFQLRLLLEPWAARQAAARELGGPSRTLLEQAHQMAQDAEIDGIDRQRLIEHDMEFHDGIVRGAGNRAVQRAFERTHCHLHLFRLSPPHLDGRHTAHEHTAISEAILAAQPRAAEAAMRDHLTASYERFIRTVPLA
ncbi:GntR family transcriptional regulator [Georgenia deserti]|uniref:GntR family transcriptional regulator n=1 Tax=Georgenia deserti TaxID=2093781 RepID=A0ABW4L6Y3_9MICO